MGSNEILDCHVGSPSIVVAPQPRHRLIHTPPNLAGSKSGRRCPRWVVYFLLAALIPVVGCGSVPPPAHLTTLDYSSLTHKLGAYGIGPDATQVKRAAQLGIRLGVGPSKTSVLTYQAALEASGTRLIDSTPQWMIYEATCPSGPASCREPDTQRINELSHRLKEYVESQLATSTIVAYYILDDYRPSLAPVLASAYSTIREADPRRPIVCGLALSIVKTNASDLHVTRTITAFKRVLQNYSPSWCDAVMIYSYASSGATPPSLQGSWDWTMSRTLPEALSALRAKGWKASRSPLIGVPQTFGWWPGGHPGGPEAYYSAPTSADLTAQVVAFCKAGAIAIVGYAWDDNAVGRVTKLNNSVPLQLGLLAGAQQCHQEYWR